MNGTKADIIPFERFKKIMQAVILSAGEGTRLHPLTKNMPKVMVPIQGKPLLQWHIEHLKKFGINEIFINLHYLPNSITDYFKNGEDFGVKITYSYEKNLLGTGGALTQFKKKLNGTFFLLFGDVFTDINVAKLYDFHQTKKAQVTVVVTKTDHPVDSDLASFFPDMHLKKFHFKPHKRLPETSFGLSGIYMIESSVLSMLPDQPSGLEKDFLSKLDKTGEPIFFYETQEFVKDIGTPERYEFVKTRLGND